MRLFATIVLVPLLLAAGLKAVDGGLPPLPDPAALVSEVEAHQRKMDEVRETFVWHEVQNTDDLDGKGKVVGTLVEEREIFYVNRHRIVRLVKRNNHEMTAKEVKDEDDRIKKLVERALREPLNRSSYREGGDLELSRILAVMSISNPRRLTLNGRATLAFDFNGNRKAAAHNIALNAAKKMSGTVWIDEADRQVARVEATLDDTFRVGGGLLGLVQKGAWLRMEQAHAGDGLWLPTISEIHYSARALLVKGMRQNIRMRDFDFKRYDVAVSQKTGELKLSEPKQ